MRRHTRSGNCGIRQKTSLDQETNGVSQEQDRAICIKKTSMMSARHASKGRPKWAGTGAYRRPKKSIWVGFLGILFWLVILIGIPFLVIFLHMRTR